jgi:hypothetical protein
MRLLAKETQLQCYEALRATAFQGEHPGLTVRALEARCNERYGVRGQGCWAKQLLALADMGYAKKGRWINGAPLWVAVAPDEQ